MLTPTPPMIFFGVLIGVFIIIAFVVACIEVTTDTTWPEWPERIDSFLKRRL